MEEWHEQDRYSDDGCPNHSEHHTPTSDPTPVMLKQQETVKRLRLKRRHKIMVHAVTITVIAVSLLFEGGKSADWGFLALSVLCEIS